MMKRQAFILCLLLCSLLLCACSQTPVTEPPADSLMTDSADILVLDGEIVRKNVYTVDYNSKNNQVYLCQQDNGVEETSPVDYDPQITSTDLTYEDFHELVDAVLVQIRKNRLGMSETEHGEIYLQLMTCGDGDNRSIASRSVGEPGSLFRYTGYYVYSISQKTLTLGDGTVMGSDAYGKLYVRNYDRYHLTLPAEEMERSYVLIAD